MATARRVLRQMLSPTQQHCLNRKGHPWQRSRFSFTCIPPLTSVAYLQQTVTRQQTINEKELASISFAAYELNKKLEAAGLLLKYGSTAHLQNPQEMEIGMQKTMWRRKDDRLREEYLKMKETKQRIDNMARQSVVKELLAGLVFLIVQTGWSFRLTFWELSWDVMEPIAFHVGCLYMLFGYGFFLVTAKDPTYRGWFVTRFKSKQKLLLQRCNFDLQRYAHLRSMFSSRRSF